jgi:acyl carrier protein
MTIEEKVKAAFVDVFGDNTTVDYADKLRIEKLTNDTVLTDFGMDSLDIVEIRIRLEEAFEISIPDEDVKLMPKYGDIINYIKRRTL